MGVTENGDLSPDGLSLSWTPSIPRLGMLGIGGTYYWNPGSDTAPSWTLTGMYGRGRDVWKLGPPLASFNGGLVFRRNGMTSTDSLGYGTSSNVSTAIPSVTVNTSIPDKNGIPQLSGNRVSSVEGGLSNSIGASRATTYTVTPQQAADALRFVRPAMGPDDELPPFVRTLQSGAGTVGQNDGASPVRFLGSRIQNPLGDGMANWRSSVDSSDPQYSAQPAPSPQQPGGLLGLLLDHLRDNPDN